MRPATLWPLVLTLPAVFAASCGPAATPDNRAADAAAIQTADEQWSAAAATHDVAATVAFYADDAVMLPPNAPIAADQKAIRDAWAALLTPTTAVSWKPTKVDVARSGELGYLYGTYSLSVKDPKGGPPVNDRGKRVEIWKKQAGGKWKCAVDIFNSDLPAPSAPETRK